MRIRLIAGVAEGGAPLARQVAQRVVQGYIGQQTGPEPLQVVLHLIGPVAQLGRDVANAQQHLLRDSFPDSWIDVIHLYGDTANEREVARQFGEFSDRLLKTDADDLVVVLVRDDLGTQAMRRVLTSVADLFEVAITSGEDRTGSDDVGVLKLEPLISGVSLPRVQRTTAVVLAGGLHTRGGLRPSVTPSLLTDLTGEHPMPSRALRALSTSWARNNSTMVSTCALLLQGYPEGVRFAERLRSLILGWERERIWDASYVNEMVLHDESHSMSVDRNVAMLCSPLLADGRFTVEDVYTLSLCAWLHDWGHASNAVLGRFPIDPVEVRRHHGPLTSLRLRDKFRQHGIEAGPILNTVRLLCAHHQGWTSCDDKEPEPQSKRRLGVIEDNGLGVGLLPDGTIGSFDNEAGTLLGTGERTPRLRQLLAIFRVADASDIGRHRVPHALSRGESHDDLLDAYLEPGRSLFGASDRDRLAQVKHKYLQLVMHVQEMTSRGSAPTDVDIKDHAKVLGAEFGAMNTSPKPGDMFAVDAWDFATHLVCQVAFFGNHGAVHGVYPTLMDGPSSGTRRLELHVFSDHYTAEGAKETVVRDVLNEFGRPPRKDPQPAKSGIGDAFEELGVERDRVEICMHHGVIT